MKPAAVPEPLQQQQQPQVPQQIQPLLPHMSPPPSDDIDLMDYLVGIDTSALAAPPSVGQQQPKLEQQPQVWQQQQQPQLEQQQQQQPKLEQLQAPKQEYQSPQQAQVWPQPGTGAPAAAAAAQSAPILDLGDFLEYEDYVDDVIQFGTEDPGAMDDNIFDNLGVQKVERDGPGRAVARRRRGDMCKQQHGENRKGGRRGTTWNAASVAVFAVFAVPVGGIVAGIFLSRR